MIQGNHGKYTEYSDATGITKDSGQSTVDHLSPVKTIVRTTECYHSSSINNSFRYLAEHIPSWTSMIRAFTNEREWHCFHRPRNLFLAWIGEVGELAASFGVKDEIEQKDQISQEVADVAIYLTRLMDVTGVTDGVVRVLTEEASLSSASNEDSSQVLKSRLSQAEQGLWQDEFALQGIASIGSSSSSLKPSVYPMSDFRNQLIRVCALCGALVSVRDPCADICARVLESIDAAESLIDLPGKSRQPNYGFQRSEASFSGLRVLERLGELTEIVQWTLDDNVALKSTVRDRLCNALWNLRNSIVDDKVEHHISS